MAMSRSAPWMLNAAAPVVAISVRTTRGRSGRVANQTAPPTTTPPITSVANGTSARRHPKVMEVRFPSRWGLRSSRTRPPAPGECLPCRERAASGSSGGTRGVTDERAPAPMWAARRNPAPVRDPASVIDDVLALECSLARQHLEEHAAERPDVGALVHGLPARLLRAHVRGGAENHPGSRHRGRRDRRRHATTFADIAVAGSIAFARPKSSTFTVPSSRTLMFAGFRSR